MEIQNLEFHEGLPSLEKVQSLNDGKFHVIVLDDLMEYIVKSVETQNLFTKYCHHYNITAIFLTQNVFAQGPCSRTISINTHILVIFANKRDESQALNLGKQLYPSNSKVFMEAYEHATSVIHGNLIIDCDPTSPRDLTLRTNIFFQRANCLLFKKVNTQKCVQYGTFTLRDNMYLREKTFLELIAYSKDKRQQCQIIKCINHDQYFELKKIAINILHGVIPLKKNQLKYLKNSKQFIRKLAEGKAKNSHLAQHFMVVCYIVKIALQYNEKCSEISFSSNRKVGKIRTKK